MTRFIGDPEDFRNPDEPRHLVVTADLLVELGVADEDRSEQERAVRHWLADNEPPKVLAASLRAEGFLRSPGQRAAG